MSTILTVNTTIHAPLQKVWDYFTTPHHIMQWNHASADWHTIKAVNDVQKGGTFSFTMAAKDGTMSFDFEGTYNEVKELQLIEYTLRDGRKVDVHFSANHHETVVMEAFEAETENPVELQQQGWQAILNTFKHYTENN
jgi:uncharacterized protein YndB with AHSA1/START domain